MSTRTVTQRETTDHLTAATSDRNGIGHPAPHESAHMHVAGAAP